MRNKNLFISIEGIEGAGKSTILPLFCAWLRAQKLVVLETREPGGSVLGETIRQILLNTVEIPIAPEAELLLLMAARVQHLQEVILPALQKGQTVVCDRFRDSTLAYQGGGRGIALEKIVALEAWCTSMRLPDKTFYLDISLAKSHQRRRDRNQPDRIEQEQDPFFERVRAVYQDLAKRFPERVVLIDAAQSVDQILSKMQASYLYA